MKRVVVALLLGSVVGAGVIAASPSYARDWKADEVRRIEEQNKRRAQELERSRSAQEAEDKARRIRYEEQRRKDLERKRYYEQQRNK